MQMETEKLVRPDVENENEEKQENVLRPKTLNEYIGQSKVKENMKVYIEAAKKEVSLLTTFYYMVHRDLEKQHWLILYLMKCILI